MLDRSDWTPVDEHAPAKVNLLLHINHRRGDGLHDLESLVVFTAFGDRVKLSPSGELGLVRTGPFAGNLPDDPRDDLSLRAAARMSETFGDGRGIRILLEKNIPVAAGIGGGSSDAAAVLRGLCRAWGVDRQDPRVIEIAAGLGADVPICLHGGPAFVAGIGDKLTAISREPEFHILLVNPNVPLSTAAVFGALETPGEPASGLSDKFRSGDRSVFLQTLRAGRNDLTPPALQLCPAVGAVLDALEQARDCELARMSGSGTTCFAIFPNAVMCRDAADSLSRAHRDWWVCPTRTASIV